MEEIKPSKRHGNLDSSGLDKLTNLPSHVIDQILCRLPIRDAARTSVLSSKWRFKWTTMPDLVFDKEFFSFTPQDEQRMKNKLVSLIDQALLLHTGPVSKFMLYQRKPISTSDLDRWILHLSRCLVQELILEIRGDDQCYKLHSCLFNSFQHLRHLKLYQCRLKLPSTFGGFEKLKSVELQSVTASQDAFQTLLSSCPVLERLNLCRLYGLAQLNIIDAPNLLEFAFEGYFDDINFINSSNIAILSIELLARLRGNATQSVKPPDFSNLLNFFSALPRIKRLVIAHNFLEYLAIGDIPRQLPSQCPDLSYLFLDLDINNYAENSAALCLLRSSPNIQELEIEAYDSLEEGKEFTIWGSEHDNCSLNKLRTVSICNVSGKKNEVELIRFLLLVSPVLQKMTIKLSSEDQALRFAKELLRFRRASTEAEVLFLESSTK